MQQGERLRQLVKQTESIPQARDKPAAKRPKVHKLSQRLSPKIEQELAAAYEAGASTSELRRRYGLSQGIILKLLADHGVATRQQGLSEAAAQAAINLYGAGHTLAQLGYRFHVSPNTVKRTLERNGVSLRPRGRYRAADRREHAANE